MTFEGDPVVFQWYPGQGLQIQPLANFGKANALWRACAEAPPRPRRRRRRRPHAHRPADRRGRADRRTPAAQPPRARPPPCRPRSCARCSTAWSRSPRERGGFTAWEYFFAFGGGTPPWISGLAQGTAIQALTRGSQLLADPRYVAVARRALGAFERTPPLGVRAPSTSGTGRHYLIYSFASGLRVLNGFLQSLVGLHDFADATGDRRARRLFRDGDRAARREIPRYDTGAWSLYSLGGNESDLGYHRLVRDFLDSLCERTEARRATARPPSASTATCTSARGSASPASARVRVGRRGEHPLHALQALVRDACASAAAASSCTCASSCCRAACAGSPTRRRGAAATRSRSRPSTCSTTTRASSGR